MFKEKKIATYTASKTRIQLLEIAENNYEHIIIEIINTIEGYKAKWSDGQEVKIYDHEVEKIARIWKLKKDNENYYYKVNTFDNEYNIKYQIRYNRKIMKTYNSEIEARRLFQNYIGQHINQLKLL